MKTRSKQEKWSVFITEISRENRYIVLLNSRFDFVKAHGAEILCSRCGSKSDTPASQTQSDSRWNSFLEALKDKGYFKVTVNIIYILHFRFLKRVLSASNNLM